MSKTLQRVTNIVFAVLVATFSVNLTGAMSLNAHADSKFYDTPTDGKITICHSHQPEISNGTGLGPQDNPYNQETVKIVAGDDDSGVSDHMHHTGVADGQPSHVYRPGDLSWGDIIPAYPAGSYEKGNKTITYPASEGLNWDAAGQAIYYNGCNIPVQDATAGVDVTEPTCERDGVASITGLANATLTAVDGNAATLLSQTVGDHTATFTATAGHVFDNGTMTLNVPYTIEEQLTGERCAGPQPQDDHDYRDQTKTVCLPNGGGTVTSWQEERTRSYSFDEETNSWVAGDWSDWTVVEGSETTRPATNEECPQVCVPSTVTLQELTLLNVNTPKNDCTPGQGGAGGETPSTPSTPVVTELPVTGPADGNTALKLATIIIAGIATYGAMYVAVNRRSLLQK